MPYSRANGVNIWYEVTGDGPAMVLIHANPFDHDLWIYQAAHFSTWFKVIGIDIRGYGRSDKVTTPYSLKDMCDDAIGVMKDLGVGHAVLGGCSVGSGIAIMLGLDHPELFDAIFLVGGNSGASGRYQTRIDGYRKNLAGLSHQASARPGGPGFRRQPARASPPQYVGRARPAAERRGDRAGIHGGKPYRQHRSLADDEGPDAGDQRRARQFARCRQTDGRADPRRSPQGPARHRSCLLPGGPRGIRRDLSSNSCNRISLCLVFKAKRDVHRDRYRYWRGVGGAAARRRLAAAADRLRLSARSRSWRALRSPVPASA